MKQVLRRKNWEAWLAGVAPFVLIITSLDFLSRYRPVHHAQLANCLLGNWLEAVRQCTRALDNKGKKHLVEVSYDAADRRGVGQKPCFLGVAWCL